LNKGVADPLEESVLVLAPIGRDGELAAAALNESQIRAEVCGDLFELVDKLAHTHGALVIAEEALIEPAIPKLLAILEAQPAWSDLPIVLLTSGGSVTSASRQAVDLLGPLANVTLLERPLRVMTLLSTLGVALRARRRQYEVRGLFQQRDQVLAAIRDSFAILDQNWRYTYVNEHTCQLCQMPCDAMIGARIWDLFPELKGTNLEVQLIRVMEERIPAQFEWRNEQWERWFTIRVYPTEGGISLLTSEITERKEMEHTLKESERRLHLALDTSKLGMWYCDLPFDKIVWDKNCRQHFGVPADQQIDFQVFYSLLHPDDQTRTREAVERAVAERTSYDIEYRAVHPDGSIRWVHAIGRAFYDQAGKATRFDGITIDITEQKKAAAELERARREAIEANAAKDHFLAALSHELRTPLTPVLMTVASLQQDPDLSEGMRADLEVVQRNVELEARLIDDLLDLTRVTRGKLILHREIVDVHQLLGRALETSRSGEVARKRLRVSFQPDAAHHHTLGDPARLQQILWNLLNNAVKFTAEGGSIDLMTRNPEPGRVEILIADSGIGIEREALPRLFDAFEQGNVSITRRFGGLGLGLAISKTLADLHGGSLRAESAGLGCGATFVLQLSTSAAPENTGTVEAPSAKTPITSLRILLVEDHDATRQALARLLSRDRHQVRIAATVAAALELAAQYPFDLVISDLGLPDASGLDLMNELRARYKLRGIALSGYGMDEDVKASAAAGFSVHLIKPVDWRRLQETLRKLPAPLPSASSGA
jgi:PAS domain S-box-containing protein